eukprot:SAG11_NODE_16125_length_556_cov_1.015317_1_plen_67_part_00
MGPDEQAAVEREAAERKKTTKNEKAAGHDGGGEGGDSQIFMPEVLDALTGGTASKQSGKTNFRRSF